MEQIFLKILNMSIAAGWLVLAVILLRLLFRKAPKAITVAMWALVGIRLICPVSIESVLSLIPSAETVPADIVYAQSPQIHSGIAAVNSTVNPVISESFAPAAGDSANPMQIIVFAATVLWIAGMIAMAVYALISYLLIYRKVREAAPLEGNIWLCDRIVSPFILGVIRPRIYLPSDMAAEDMEYVLAHERAHLSRRDHWWKPLGFLLLTVYWFNPLLWAAYILLCRDIELACDEKVIARLGTEIKKPYSDALINCSAPRRAIAACPLAFGEVGVKSRIKSVLSYKKPAFWVIVLAVVACIAVAVCFLTDPKAKDPNIDSPKNYSELDGVSVEITSADLTSEYPFIEIKWSNGRDEDIMYGNEFYIYRYEDGEWIDCRVKEENVFYSWTDEGYICTAGGTSTKKYRLDRIEMTEPGKYRFETNCCFYVGKDVEYKLWIDFELSYTSNGTYELSSDKQSLVTTVHTPYLNALMEKYPEYFGLDTSNGLEVYVWQMAENSYSWGLMPGKSTDYTWQELMCMPSARLEEMQAIVESYGLPKSQVEVIPTYMLHSSYLYTIDDEYRWNIEAMFWSYYPTDSRSIGMIDLMSFDIDGDGIVEQCTIGYGPTSGLFTFTISASENGTPEYFNIFCTRFFYLSFVLDEDGVVKLRAETQEEEPNVYYFYISVEDGNIVLKNEDLPDAYWYWGEQGVKSDSNK